LVFGKLARVIRSICAEAAASGVAASAITDDTELVLHHVRGLDQHGRVAHECPAM